MHVTMVITSAKFIRAYMSKRDGNVIGKISSATYAESNLPSNPTYKLLITNLTIRELFVSNKEK